LIRAGVGASSISPLLPDENTMNARHHRQRQIAEVLARHGWGFLLDATGLEHLRSVERELRGREPRDASPSRPEHLRLALEELGATFVKLGQILSTRADLLPPEYRVELAKLQDQGSQVAPQAVRDALEHELGGDVESVFASFDLDPMAAASIGQAHAATLHDGTEVVVKVRRPGVVETVEQDLEIVRNCAVRASRRWEEAAAFDVVGLADEFSQTLRAQMDYLREGRNAEQFAANFAGNPDVQIPRVLWETTTSRVITLERIRGIKITDLAALDAAGVDRHELAQRAVAVMAKMVFDDGFFHGDPHPGNFFICTDGRLGIIDFGLVGALNDDLREQLGRLLLALVREDPDRLATALLALGAPVGPVDRTQLRDDLSGFLDGHSGEALEEVPLGAAIGEVQEIVRRNRLRVPGDLVLLLTAFVMEEGMAAELDPQFRLAEALRPYAYRELALQLSPGRLARRLKQVGADIGELSIDLPDQLHRALGVLAGGGFEVHLRAAELEPLIARVERVGNRLAVSVLVAAVIDGVAALAAGEHPRRASGRRRNLPAMLVGVGSLGAYGSRKRQRSGRLARRR
jgi:ubiquinone biosynthesis protein